MSVWNRAYYCGCFRIYIILFLGGVFIFALLYSTLLQLQFPRLHCVGAFWNRTQDSFRHWLSDALQYTITVSKAKKISVLFHYQGPNIKLLCTLDPAINWKLTTFK